MDLSQAVSKTKAYGAFFNFPLYPQELHYWLICPRPIPKSSLLQYPHSLNPQEVRLRKILQKTTDQKVKVALEIKKYSYLFPTIRLIALTGSVAAKNSHKNDDIDLMIITSPHTLWFTRPLFLLFLSLNFNRRHPGDNEQFKNNAFCPNLWLDTTCLTISKEKRNLYTAHEVLQVKPLYEKENTYAHFINSNQWTSRYLANAYKKLASYNLKTQFKPISSFILAPLNYILYLMQYLYMLPKKTTEKVSLHSAYFHKNDLSKDLSRHIKQSPLSTSPKKKI